MNQLYIKGFQLQLAFQLLYNYFFWVYLIWSLTVREEQKLRVFENRVLRRIFGPKRDGVTGG
jgi:hypothetical protein